MAPANPNPIPRRGRGSPAIDDMCEEEQHVGSSASAHPDGLQHLAFNSGLPCKEQHVAEPASAQTLHELDALSLKDAIEASLPSGRCISSSLIWKRRDFEWAITFYTVKDLRGYFRTFPHVGGPFQSKDEAYKAIDRYLTDHRDLTMGMGLSEVDKLIQQHRYFPDGSKKRLKAGQPIDKKRDTNYQLVQALLYKYNDHHNLIGDLAYEVKDVLDEPKYWEEENYRIYIHMNFTAKTKGSDGFDTGSDNLFFAEVTCVSGDDGYVVNCCCMVKPFDNGRCIGCGTTMKTTLKHPSDRSAYTGGHMNAYCSRPFGSFSAQATWVYEEDSDEEVERLRTMFEGGRATAA
ncbi:unnamed protein product [Alopecurus aequalis]